MSKPKLVFYGAWGERLVSDSVVRERFGWLISHLASPKSKTSDGPICPWAGHAVGSKRFFVGDARRFPSSLAGLLDAMDHTADQYRGSSVFTPGELHPTTLTVLLNDGLQAETIEEGLQLRRPLFTPEGLMLGALDPYNTLTSLAGADGFPYRAPWNFLTVRWMVPGDYVFLDLNPQYREIYCQFFGGWPAPNKKGPE